VPKKMLSILAVSVALAVLAPATTASSATCWSYSSNERGFAHKINKARSGRGLTKLKLDPQLAKVATVQTRRMIRLNLLHHTPNLGRRVTHWNSLAENVGYGGDVASLHKAFMKSAPHKANILRGKYRFFGVAAKKAANGTLWVTVVFESKRNPGTTLDMPNC
jgi:uncharacterized protein YkwD